MSTVVVLACRTGNNAGRDVTLKSICRAALPLGYFSNFIDVALPQSPNGAPKMDSDAKPAETAMNVNGEPSQVIAMSSVCPTQLLSPYQFNTVVMVSWFWLVGFFGLK
jgi:hypothetical protein